MARYMTEKAPNVRMNINADDFTIGQRRTEKERHDHSTKEFILKCQVEMALMRVMRPDLVQKTLHKLVGSIYDYNY